MLDVLPYLSRIINAVSTILTLVGIIQQKQETVAQETNPYEIQGIAVNIQHQTLDTASFAGTIPAQIKNLSDLVALNQLALLTAIGAAQQGGAPVTLPTVPPSGYAPVSASDITDAVWNGTPGSYGPSTLGGSLREAGAYAAAYIEPSIALNGGYWVPDGVVSTAVGDVDGFAPNFDATNILSTDDLLSMLTRQNPGNHGIGWNDGMGGHVFIVNAFGNPQEWVTTIDQTDFLRLKALLYPPAPSVAAPVWPGVAGVTLLTPVAFSDSFSINETMAGVLIAITTAPSKQGTFDFDGLVSYRNAGAVAFLSDDGEAELSQPLGFEEAVYCAHSMVAASGVKVRVTPGLSGTCTPFTIP